MLNALIFALLLALASILSETIFLKKRRSGKHGISLLWKAAASGSFCLTGAVLAGASGSPQGPVICLGLTMGLMGDVLLGLRKLFPGQHDLAFRAGALAFSVGHVFYMIALGQTARLPWAPVLLIFLVLMAGAELFARRGGFAKHKMHLPGLLYIGIEACMAAMALTLPWLHRTPGAFLFAAGSLSFFCSDSLLCAYSFGTMKTLSCDRAVHVTYLCAQLLIAFSVPFL